MTGSDFTDRSTSSRLSTFFLAPAGCLGDLYQYDLATSAWLALPGATLEAAGYVRRWFAMQVGLR
jgi:hypothetical protein